jgi:hypothetical protein
MTAAQQNACCYKRSLMLSGHALAIERPHTTMHRKRCRRAQEWHLRHTMRTWRAHAVRKKTKLVDEKVKRAQEDVREQTVRMKDEEAAALRQQLLETKRALAVEKHAREMLAQDMKRSFMRGVCALNMEAMQVRLLLCRLVCAQMACTNAYAGASGRFGTCAMRASSL